MLEGAPDVWIDGHLHRLGAGDAVGFPAGTGLCHTFLNNTGDPVRLLVIGEAARADNKVYYPCNPEMMPLRKDWWQDVPHRPKGPHHGKPGERTTGPTAPDHRPDCIVQVRDHEGEPECSDYDDPEKMKVECRPLHPLRPDPHRHPSSAPAARPPHLLSARREQGRGVRLRPGRRMRCLDRRLAAPRHGGRGDRLPGRNRDRAQFHQQRHGRRAPDGDRSAGRVRQPAVLSAPPAQARALGRRLVDGRAATPARPARRISGQAAALIIGA